MPYTEEFKRLRRRFSNQYSDKAKAETFAFEKAFKLDIRTFTDKKPRQRVLKNPFELNL